MNNLHDEYMEGFNDKLMEFLKSQGLTYKTGLTREGSVYADEQGKNLVTVKIEHVTEKEEQPKLTFYDDEDLCPIHHCQVVMAVYGDVDAGFVCPKCEEEQA